jgi:hypothetical protein
MKFNPGICIFFLLTTVCSHAQVSYGILGGMQQVGARVKVPDGARIPASSGYGFHAGGMLKVPFDKNVFFSPQILYSYKSFTIRYNNILQDSVTASKLVLHYIEIPALLEFDTRSNGNGFFFLFGPSVSVAVTGKERRTLTGNSEQERRLRFANTAYGRFEMNLVAKMGYCFKNRVTVTGGYSYGLGSIINDDYFARIVPRMITLGAGYFFGRK